MYTLRVSFLECVKSANGASYSIPRDYYCCNLSIDHNKAYAKAKEYVAMKSENCFLVEQKDVPTLEDIYRRNKEELEAARLLAEETAKYAQEQHEERLYQARLNKIDLIKAGCWCFGIYKDKSFGNELGKGWADLNYIKFMMSIKTDDIDDHNHKAVMDFLQFSLKQKFDYLNHLPVPNGEYFGSEKQRLDLQFTLIAEITYMRDSYNGYNREIVYIQKFVKDTGELLVYHGTAPINCKLAETLKVKATIKKHNEYKNEKQTIISRPKLIENYGIITCTM